MKKLFSLLFLFTGCASLPFKITGWKDDSNRVYFENGQSAIVAGNPHIKCYDKGEHLIADGIFVRIDQDQYYKSRTYLIVDEFGKDYARVLNSQGNYCKIWEQE